MLSFQYNDNKYYKNNQTKNEEKPASDQNKVRADIFSGSLAVCLFASASRRGGRKGGLVFALPPAEPVYEIGSPACRQAGIFSNTHRQLEKEAFGSPATRARQPILNAKLNFLSLFRKAERQKRAFLNF